MNAIDQLIKSYKLETKAWVRARVNLYFFSIHPGAMKNFFSKIAIVCSVLSILGSIGLLVLIVATPDAPLSHEAQQFKAFEAAYIKAYDSFRTDKFNKEVKGEFVRWEGLTLHICHSGTIVTIVPIQGETVRNRHPRLTASLHTTKDNYVPTGLGKHGQRVRITGRISDVSVLGVIVVGKVEAL